ncbi:MAG TPA: YigZ family protein [Bacteroidales bacterium]|nr:YigZ family protein [Bacteroidales bacterium]
MCNVLIYRTVKESAQGLYREKGSKFLSFVHPVTSEHKVKIILNNYRTKFYDARHHCFAFRIGIKHILERSNDDGEPSGTAGKPILGQLYSYNLTNTIIVVVRYFGGTKLGVGGLINAYKTAAKEAIIQASIIEETLKEQFVIQCSYDEMGKIIGFLKQQKINYYDIKMEEIVSMKIILDISQTKTFIEKLNKIFKTIQISKIKKIN